jgi:predicted SprT family Zn-dependent metalloprotease
MQSLLDKFKSKLARSSEKKEAKCKCGEILMTFPNEEKELYFCNSCHKLLYFLESDLEVPKLFPFSLDFFKRKK